MTDTTREARNSVCQRDDLSQTEETLNLTNKPSISRKGGLNESEISIFAKLEHEAQEVDEFDISSKDGKATNIQQVPSHSDQIDSLDVIPSSGDFEFTSWTVRNSEGYQEELLKHNNDEDPDLHESDIDVLSPRDVSTQNSLCNPLDFRDDSIYVHMLLSLPEAVNDEIWNEIQSSLKVTQSVMEHELMLPISQSAFYCCQRSEEIPTCDSKLAREISACITMKHCVNSTPTRYLFQLFLAISKRDVGDKHPENYWNVLNAVAFVQLPSTGQLLLPIEREFSRKEALDATEGMFLGSFFMHHAKLYHHVPNELSLRSENVQNSCPVSRLTAQGEEDVVVVDRKDILLEPNGARAGRPSHRRTGQLLMTLCQVEKVLEIRKRWEGLSPRQRRDNVTNADFYSFLTLNRDETAECLGVCATWLKDAIRSQGVNVWPGRPLRRTGAMLQTLKESLESARAALRFSDPAIVEVKTYEADIQHYETEIRDLLAMRTEIVKANVSREYFDRFVQENGKHYLNPDWIALPPRTMHKHKG